MPVIQPIGLREIILLLVTIIAYSYTPEEIYQANEFDFGPMKEVAFLFAGLFITMVPALQIISAESYRFGARLNPTAFFWGSGMLSSILDNAPTYLNFLSGAMGKFGLNSNSVQQVGQFLGFGASYIIAISIACVFFGAMTYIGNGPNFMVKAVSEKAGMKMPSFFGYIKGYSVPVLLPVFLIIWFLFLR
jgi:Na+/H+ antiporter NhaD/arsenite permease-like protein